MKILLLRGILVALVALAAATPASAARPRVLAVHFDTEVNPVTQDYVTSEISRANKDGYAAVAILLDTPGGLEDSMRKIYQAELASKVPVIVYVSPNGARAASAGVWIAYASDLLAMAPTSNIGSSTPIDQSGGDIKGALGRKVRNDAVASLVALAKSHGRDQKFAHDAVVKASNLDAQTALHRHVVDMIAPSLPALLRKADGFVTKPKHDVLHLAGAQIVEVHPGFFTRFLNVLIDPNLISLLFLAGIVGIGYEIFHPGVVLPGALGAVALVASLFGLFVLPITWAGIVLVLLGLGLLVVDAHVTTHGALTIAGLISLAVGFAMLFNTGPGPYHVNTWYVVSLAVVLGGLWAFALSRAVQVRRRPVAVGPHTMVGQLGEVRRDGLVFVNGELWRARADDELRPGERVQVDEVDGLVLRVHGV